jgi:hypothetical protein
VWWAASTAARWVAVWADSRADEMAGAKVGW